MSHELAQLNNLSPNKTIVREDTAIRQIFVFTKSPLYDTSQQIKSAANSLKREVAFINPFDTGHTHISNDKFIFENLPSPCADDLLLLRTSGILFDDWDLTLAELWQRNFNIRLSHPLHSLKILRDKSLQTLWLNENKLPHIPTSIFRGPATALPNMGEHYVIKSVRGNKGIGVHRFNRLELEEFWKKVRETNDQRYLIQPFIKAKTEKRLLVLGEHIFSLEKRGVSWKKNSDTAEFKEVQIHSREKTLARRIQEKLDCQCFAIDLFVDNDNLQIIEINANPGLTEAGKAIHNIDLAQTMLNAFGVR